MSKRPDALLQARWRPLTQNILAPNARIGKPAKLIRRPTVSPCRRPTVGPHGYTHNFSVFCSISAGKSLDQQPMASYNERPLSPVSFQSGQSPATQGLAILPVPLFPFRILAAALLKLLISRFHLIVWDILISLVRCPFVQIGFHRNLQIQLFG